MKENLTISEFKKIMKDFYEGSRKNDCSFEEFYKQYMDERYKK